MCPSAEYASAANDVFLEVVLIGTKSASFHNILQLDVLTTKILIYSILKYRMYYISSQSTMIGKSVLTK
jgi:hypothetical protein